MTHFLSSQLSTQGLKSLPTLACAGVIKIQPVYSQIQSLLKSWGGFVNIPVLLDASSALSPANQDVVGPFI